MLDIRPTNIRVSASTGSENDWHMPQRLEFGARNNNSENSMGQIAEFIMFHGLLTDIRRQKVESHLAFKYGLTLDSNHLFGSMVDALNKNVEVPDDISGNDLNATSINTIINPDRYNQNGNGQLGDQNQTIFTPELQVGENGFTVMGWVKTNSNNGEIFSLGKRVKVVSFFTKSPMARSRGVQAIRPIVLMLIHLLIHGITLQLPLNQ